MKSSDITSLKDPRAQGCIEASDFQRLRLYDVCTGNSATEDA